MPTAAARTTTPQIVEPESVFERMKELYQSIANRAHELFEARGREHGHDLEDWLRAESELLRLIPIEMVETDDELSVNASVPGFSAKDLQISVEPRRLIICGRKEQAAGDRAKDTTYTEQSNKEIFQELDLPVEVDPKNATAKLKKNVLNVRLPKAESGM